MESGFYFDIKGTGNVLFGYRDGEPRIILIDVDSFPVESDVYDKINYKGESFENTYLLLKKWESIL